MTTTPKQAMSLPPKSCFYHQDCAGTNQACSQSQCTDLCFSEDCNKGVNNARDVWGYTPLHMLHIYSVAVVKRLLENHANVNSASNEGLTALHIAAIHNNVDVAELLLENSADLNATAVSGSRKGLTPLQVAEKEGNQEMVELLRNPCRFMSY